jgi:trk system potassium uptake protein TrkA
MVETFAQGKVQMREMVVRHDSAAAGKRIRDLFPPESNMGALALSITRGSRLDVPGPDDRLEDGDLVSVVMPVGTARKVRELFHETEAPARSVVIAGGGTTAMMLAQTLESRDKQVKLIEEDRSRCDELALVLKHTQIIHGDATRQSVMEEERVADSDIFVAMCGEDEVNLMAALQAREMGVKHVTFTVNRADYAPLVERLGIQHAVSPRILTGNRVLMLVGRYPILSSTLLHEGRAEVIELMAQVNSKVVNRRLGDEVRFPKGTILGAIVRGDSVFIPRGGDIVEPGDTCIAFALSSSVEDLTALFRGRR